MHPKINNLHNTQYANLKLLRAIAKANCAFEISSATQLALALAQLCTTRHRAVTKHAVALTQLYITRRCGIFLRKTTLYFYFSGVISTF